MQGVALFSFLLKKTFVIAIVDSSSISAISETMHQVPAGNSMLFKQMNFRLDT
jgi:hypothetical protein